MNHETTKNKMSESLLNKNVYCVCFVERDGADILSDEFAEMRKDFFEGGQKPVKRNVKDDVISGFNARLKGKLRKNRLYWKRTAGKMVTEESFPYNGGHAVVKRDYFGVVGGKIYFDKSHLWIKSEYFNSSNQSAAQVIFKPVSTLNCIERFDYIADRQVYESTILFPAPYMPGTAEQSIINANYGEPQLILSTKDGLFCYCEKEEALKREKALTDIKNGTIVLMPAWEVREGKVQTEQDNRNDRDASAPPSFTRLDMPAGAAPVLPENSAAIKAETATASTKKPQSGIGKTEFPEADSDLVMSAAGPKDTYIEEKPAATDAPKEPSVPSVKTPAEGTLTEPAANTKETEEILQAARSIQPLEEEKAPEESIDRDKNEKEEPLPAGESPKVIVAGEIQDYDETDPEVVKILEMAKQSYRMPEIRAVSLEVLSEAQHQTGKTAEPADCDVLLAAKSAAPSSDKAAPVQSGADTEEGLLNFSGEDAAVAAVPAADGVGDNSAITPAPSARKRIDQQQGITAYEGEYRDGMRHGFGAYYYRNGNLCYAGSFKEDKKEGLGVSFRSTDHALHVTNWQQDRPGEFVTLFDKDGNLKYSGRIVDGKKVGAGIAYDRDGNIFISKWQDGRDTGFGSVFDRDGDLIYTGMWKDGNRHGTGTEFNKQGEVVFSGEWKEGVQWGGILYKSDRGQEE